MSDAIQPWPAEFDRFFEESLGLEPLPSQPGEVELSDAEWRNYCRMAARWGAPRVIHEGSDLRAAVVGYYTHLLVAVMTGDERAGYFEVDGEPYVRDDEGDIKVTMPMVRHWWWMQALLADREAARAFLAAAPAWAREQAVDHADADWSEAFEDLTDGLEPED